ncbi:MAG TPA: DUF2214 family protein [Stellaceae bacterium]|nr:DUF2214 family protein [Stellaceae bacterium]
MIAEATAAYAHFLAVFVTLSLLVAEASLYRRQMTAATVALLRRLDLGYLFGAIAIIATGLLRVFFFAKGSAFYAANPIFWVKMALFVLVGLLSVPPTLHYMRNTAKLRDGAVAVDPSAYRAVRRYLILQLVVFAIIPLAAALMARGVGM